MRAKHIQYVLAGIFLGLGGWCLVAPDMVETLVLTPDYRDASATSRLLFQCFGAQAVLAGVLLLVSTLSPRGFLIFGLAGSLPFFVFNYYFLYVVPMFTNWMALDFAGNIGILICGLIGWRLRRRELGNLKDSRWQDLY